LSRSGLRRRHGVCPEAFKFQTGILENRFAVAKTCHLNRRSFDRCNRPDEQPEHEATQENRFAVAKTCHLKIKGAQFVQTTPALFKIFVTEAQPQTWYVAARIGCDQHAPMLTAEKCHLASAVAGHMNGIQTASHWQFLSVA
jgi:hypothetical protein